MSIRLRHGVAIEPTPENRATLEMLRREFEAEAAPLREKAASLQQAIAEIEADIAEVDRHLAALEPPPAAA